MHIVSGLLKLKAQEVDNMSEYLKFQVAEYHFETGNLDSSIICLDDISDNYKVLPYDLKKYAEIYSLADNTDKVVNAIKKMKTYGFDKGFFERLQLENAFSQYNIQVILDTVHQKQRNCDIEKEISCILEADQTIRRLTKERSTKTDNYKLIKYIDSINFYCYKELISKHGFQGYDDVSPSIVQEELVLILHFIRTPILKQKWSVFFQDLLFDECKQGNLGFDEFAWLYDEWLYLYTKKQRYGTMKYTDKGKRWYFPFDDTENIDYLRRKVGLCPLWMDAVIQKTQLPVTYKK